MQNPMQSIDYLMNNNLYIEVIKEDKIAYLCWIIPPHTEEVASSVFKHLYQEVADDRLELFANDLFVKWTDKTEKETQKYN